MSTEHEKALAEAMGWEIDESQARVCFFVPEAERKTADVLGELIPSWDIDQLEPGEGAIIWASWLLEGERA